MISQNSVAFSELYLQIPTENHLREGIAAVVIEGSGRAADIIAYAYKNATKTSKS